MSLSRTVFGSEFQIAGAVQRNANNNNNGSNNNSNNIHISVVS